jgi:hypothetical protein
MRPRTDVFLAPTAHALRPVRALKNNDCVHYTATTFPNGPRAGCERMLRILDATGHLKGVPGDKLEDLWLDVLDDAGDILQEWPIDRRGFEYLRSKLRFVRETR